MASERDGSGRGSKAPAQALFVAVLDMALQDLLTGRPQDRDESIRLLTATEGDYARHRDWLAENAGLDPAAFFRWAAERAEAARTACST